MRNTRGEREEKRSDGRMRVKGRKTEERMRNTRGERGEKRSDGRMRVKGRKNEKNG